MRFALLCLIFLGAASCATDRNQGLPSSVVQETIVRHYPQIQNCYMANMGVDAHVGVVTAHFKIDSQGRAKEIYFDDESLGTNSLDSCLREAITAISFPAPKGGVNVTVRYPFKFEADSQLTKAAVSDVLKTLDTTACLKEMASTRELRVKLTIDRAGRMDKMRLVFDGSDLKNRYPCLARNLRRQTFPKIRSKQFKSVSVIVKVQEDGDSGQNLSQAR